MKVKFINTLTLIYVTTLLVHSSAAINSCIVDQCLQCEDSVTPTCFKCKSRFMLITLYGSEKGTSYNDCYSVFKIGGLLLAGMALIAINLWACLTCY